MGYDQGYRSTGSVDPKVTVPSITSNITNIKVSVTWRKQKGGFQNDCGTGDTQSWPYHNETQFRVQSPSGKIITLVNTNTYGGSNNPTVTTVFEDGATPVNFYSPPVSGIFAPAQPLSGFIGENPTGTWTLLPYDNYWKDPLCVSGFSVTFSEAQNGTITWWDAPMGGNQVGTGSEFIPTNTAAGTYTYYAQGQCVRGCPSVRTASTLTILPTPTAPVISVNVPDVNGTKSICFGNPITLTATGCTSTVRWNSNQNGTNFATGATYTFTPSGSNFSNTTHSFTAICEGSNLCKSVSSNTISVIVKYKPAQPSISGPGNSICLNSNVSLTASACSGGTLGWTGNRSGNSINFVLTNTVNIKVACTVNSCTSDSSNIYSITALPKPSTPTVNASQIQALCLGDGVTLSSSCANGIVTKWTGNLTGNPITVNPTTTRNYRASCLGANGCPSDSSAALTIVVLPKTKPTITGSTFICGTGAGISVTLTATGCSGTNETVMWRNQDTGTTYTETISQTKTFRSVCIRGGYCVSDSSDIFTVQYRNKPSQPTITPPQNTTICQGASVSLTASACTGGTLGWTGGLNGQTVSVSPNATRNYKVACTINGCTSDSSSAVTITVNPTPVISVSANKTSICGGDTATLTVSGCTGTILWSNGATTSLIKVSPITNTTYTATCTLGSCSSNQSVTITALSTPNVTASGILQCGQTVTLTANNVPVGFNIQWRKDGVDIANATNGTLLINSAGSYDFSSYKVESKLVNGSSSWINSVKFISPLVGFISQQGSQTGILKTIDGGNTWVNVYSSTVDYNDITFINSSVGFAGGTGGKILKTTDGGNTWSPTQLNNNNTLFKIVFKDNNTGITFSAGPSGSDVIIYYTNNQGQNWNIASFNFPSAVLTGICFVPNTSNVFAVGLNVNGNQSLFKSSDNGATWTNISNNISLQFDPQNIIFTSATSGILIGSSGGIMKTVDGGNSWQTVSSGVSSYMSNIQFIDQNKGYIAGSLILLKTIDGGNNWIQLNVPSNAYTKSISFISENEGWLGSYYGLYKYTAPQCPTKLLVVAPPQRPNAPTITPPTNSTICQGSSITLSATGCTGGTFAWTGGLTGTSISISPSITKTYKVACTLNTCTSDSSSVVTINVTPAPVFSLSNNKTSICSGDTATLTVTGCTGTVSWSDGATTSVIKVSPATNTTYTATCTLGSCSSNQSVTITALSTPNVTASGILQCGQPVTLTANNVPVGSSIQWRKDGVDIVNATNGTLVINSAGSYDFTVGATISTQLQINTTSVSDIRFIDLNNGYLFNTNNLWKTTNGGTNWVNTYSHTSNFEDVYFIDSNNGWAITQQNILKTTNGGLNWTVYNNYWSGVTLSKMTFKNLNTGIIVTSDGRSLSTTNGGVTWYLNTNVVESNVSSWQFKKLVYIPNTNSIILAYRSNGTTLVKLTKSIDNGASWTTITFPNVSYLSDIYDMSFVDSNNGWFVGYEYDKLLMRTIDGGSTWTRLNSIMSSGNYNKVDFITPQIGYVQALDYSTFNNRIYKTKDAGATWSIFMNVDNNNNYLNTNNIKIEFLSEDNGWVVSQAPNTNQSILKKISTPQCTTTHKIITNICCSTFETIKSGLWTDPTTWSCNRAPTATDDVIINIGHTITNSSGTIRAKSLNYRGGNLQISSTSNLILGN